MLANRTAKNHVRSIDFASRSSLAADKSILFRPQTDLAFANAICHVIVEKKFLVGVAAASVMIILPSYIFKDNDLHKVVIVGE